MKEKEKVIFVLILIFFLQSLAFYSYSKIISKTPSFYEFLKVDYKGDLNKDSYITITEDALLKIKDYGNVIYRSFDEKIYFSPVSTTNNGINILDVNCSLGIPYISLDNELYLKKEGHWININELGGLNSLKYYKKIKNNEVGCYYEENFYGKELKMKVVYQVSSEEIKEHNYKHSLFSKEHFFIKKLNVFSKDYLNIPKDVPIVINLKERKVEIKDFNWLAYLFFAILNLLIFLIWYFFGRDKEFLVPKYLHTYPLNPETGQKEDYLTYGLMYNLGQVNENILMAILFSLKLKGVLINVQKENRLLGYNSIIFTLDKNKFNLLNPKEKEFLNKLLSLSKVKENNNYLIAEFILNKWNVKDLLQFLKYKFANYINKRMDNSAVFLIIFLLIINLLTLFLIFKALKFNTSYFENLFFAIVVISIFSTGLLLFLLKNELVRFKKDYYKEFLEIEAFRNMLKNFAQLKKYLPEDEVLWKDWLLIGTALGVADNVIKALKERGYKIEELLKYKEEIKPVISYIYSVNTNEQSFSSSTGTNFGGFGGGGSGIR
jgi:uncharacterized membrane protein